VPAVAAGGAVCGGGPPGEQAATSAINTNTASHNERPWNKLCLLVIDVAEIDARVDRRSSRRNRLHFTRDPEVRQSWQTEGAIIQFVDF